MTRKGLSSGSVKFGVYTTLGDRLVKIGSARLLKDWLDAKTIKQLDTVGAFVPAKPRLDEYVRVGAPIARVGVPSPSDVDYIKLDFLPLFGAFKLAVRYYFNSTDGRVFNVELNAMPIDGILIFKQH